MNYKFKVGDRIVVKKDPIQCSVDKYMRWGFFDCTSPLIIHKIDEKDSTAYVRPLHRWVHLEDIELKFSYMLEKILE